eukprot:15245071-Alexandrium_andersonii.AAC.1
MEPVDQRWKEEDAQIRSVKHARPAARFHCSISLALLEVRAALRCLLARALCSACPCRLCAAQ